MDAPDPKTAMTTEARQATEELLKTAFLNLLAIARRERVTIKRMRELLVDASLRELKKQGHNSFETMAIAGFSRRAIRLLLNEDKSVDRTDLLARFMGNWAADPNYPAILPLSDRTFPSFPHLHDEYGSDFTRPGLLKVLEKHGLVEIEDGMVRAVARAVTSQTAAETLDFEKGSIKAFFSTLIHNLANPADRRTLRRLYSRQIPPERLPQLLAELKPVFERFRSDVLAILDRHEQFGGAPGTPAGGEVGVGLYWYQLPPTPDEAEKPDRPPEDRPQPGGTPL